MHDVERFSRWAPTYERHLLRRLIFDPVQRAVLDLAAAEVPRAQAILDVGCGTGRLLRSAAERFPGARLEGVDAAEGMVKQAKASIPAGVSMTVQLATAERLPFLEREFDLVFSTMTFHHWPDQKTAIGEVSRVMKPAGRWLLADFIPGGAMRYIRRLLSLKHFPERNQFDAMLAPAGLRVVAERRVQGGISVLSIAHR